MVLKRATPLVKWVPTFRDLRASRVTLALTIPFLVKQTRRRALHVQLALTIPLLAKTPRLPALRAMLAR